MSGSKRGKEIDRYPVIRMKRCAQLVRNNPEDYGTRTDYAGGTTAVLAQVIDQFPNAREYWGYIKAKHPGTDYRDVSGIAQARKRTQNLYIPADVHFQWLERYYQIRGNDRVRYSTGMGLIIAALSRLTPKTLILCGFDSVVSPNDTDWSSTLATKTYDWANDPPHDFVSENMLLEELKAAYPTRIEVMD